MTPGRETKAISYYHTPSDEFSHSKQGKRECGKRGSLRVDPTNILSLSWVRIECVPLDSANPIKRGKASWLLVWLKAKGRAQVIATLGLNLA